MNKKGGMILLGIAFAIGLIIGIIISTTVYKYTSIFTGDKNKEDETANLQKDKTCLEKDNTFTTVSTNYTLCDRCCSNNCTHYPSACTPEAECLQAHKCF